MTPFCEFVLDLLRAWRPVTARRMFGGHGIYHESLMFALISGQQLYLKVDAQSRPVFEAAGLTPFVYEAKGRQVALSYHRAPEAMLDEPALAREWAERGRQAALRAQLRKKTRPSPGHRPPGR
jgi:DNA transformation protein